MGNIARQNFERERPLRSEIFSRDTLSRYAAELATLHNGQMRRFGRKNLHARLFENSRVVEQCYFTLADAAKNQETLTAGAEWLLDNYHVVEEHVRDIKKHLPRGYYRALPVLSEGEYEGFPLVYHLALEVIVHSDAVLDRELLDNFVRSYQTKLVLSIGELWAIPIMLRLALIENLRRLATSTILAQNDKDVASEIVLRVVADEKRSSTDILLAIADEVRDNPRSLDSAIVVHVLRGLRTHTPRTTLTVEWLQERLREKGLDPEELTRLEHHAHAANQISIGNTITSLKTVSSLSWKEWFEEMSHVDVILRQDPAKIYSLCDFITRDTYRHEVEKLAKSLNVDEVSVTNKVVELASAGQKRVTAQPPDLGGTDDCRAGHVGYYLVREGKKELERALGLKRSLVHRMGAVFRDQIFVVYLSAILIITGLLIFYACY